MRKERIVQCSPRGKRTLELLQYLEHAAHEQLTDISTQLVDSISNCITGGQQKIPSTAKGHMWSAFHKCRCDPNLHKLWSTFIECSLPAHVHCQETQLVLQLLLDRIMKKLLENKAKETKTLDDPEPPQPLSSPERNAIRYMAGYVAIKLLKKFRNQLSTPNLKSNINCLCRF